MFKIGDRVRIVEEVYDREGILKGQTGIVKEIHSSNSFGVYPDILNHPKISDQNWTFDGNEVELIKEDKMNLIIGNEYIDRYGYRCKFAYQNEGEVVFDYEKYGILSFSKEGYEYENAFWRPVPKEYWTVKNSNGDLTYFFDNKNEAENDLGFRYEGNKVVKIRVEEITE